MTKLAAIAQELLLDRPRRNSGGGAKANRPRRGALHRPAPALLDDASSGAHRRPEPGVADPRVGWPANGSSPPGVKIRSW